MYEFVSAAGNRSAILDVDFLGPRDQVFFIAHRGSISRCRTPHTLLPVLGPAARSPGGLERADLLAEIVDRWPAG